MSRILLILAASLLFAATPANAVQFTGDADSGAQVLKVFRGWTSAYAKGDLDGTMSIFDPGVIFIFQGSRDQGYADLRKGYVQDFATRRPGTTWVANLEEIHAEGNMAIVRSGWQLRVKSGAAGSVIRVHNRSVDILSKASGNWRIIRSFNFPEK